jgi:hypothetical protein
MLGDYYDKPLRILPLNTVIQMALDDSEDMVLFGVEKYLQKRAKELKDKL